MIEIILRAAAILLMIGVIVGAGQIGLWLAAPWFRPATVVPLSVQPFKVSHGDKEEKEEGKHLASRFVRQIQHIQDIMSADLSNLGDANQVRIESVLPKTLHLAPDVPVKIDIELKAFDVDVVGVFERLHNFFDRSDQLQVSMWVNEQIKLFAALKTIDQQRFIGPWWLDRQEDERASVDKFAYVYALDLYRAQVHGLEQLEPDSFAVFVAGLEGYQRYVRTRHSDPRATYTDALKKVGDLFQKIVNDGKASSLVFSYLGSVRSLQNEADAAIEAYTHAAALAPDDAFAAQALKHLQEAKVLQPVHVTATATAPLLNELQKQKLPGYDTTTLPPPHQDIAVAVISTGIGPQLVGILGARLLHSSSTVSGEVPTDDYSGFGTSVTALVAALAPAAKIVAIKSLSASGSGVGVEIAKGITNAVKEHAKVILLPFGAHDPIKEVEDAIREALSSGSLVVAAAGNENSERPVFPASLPNVLAVGAVDTTDKPATFSNRGPDVVYAPGVDILVMRQDGGLAKQSGTSFSAAVGSAIAAVVWAAKPGLSAQQIRELLDATSVDLGPADPGNPKSKIRRLDLSAALSHAG